MKSEKPETIKSQLYETALYVCLIKYIPCFPLEVQTHSTGYSCHPPLPRHDLSGFSQFQYVGQVVSYIILLCGLVLVIYIMFIKVYSTFQITFGHFFHHSNFYWSQAGMRIRIRSDPLIFGLPDPDSLLFSLDPTCNNGFINYFHLKHNINQNQQIQA